MPGTWVQAILRAGAASTLAVAAAVLVTHPPGVPDLPGGPDCLQLSSGGGEMSELSVHYCEDHHRDDESGTVTVSAPSGTVRVSGTDGIRVDPSVTELAHTGLFRVSVSVDPGGHGTVRAVWQDASGGSTYWETVRVLRDGDGWAFEVAE